MVDSCTITLGGRVHHASLDGEIVRVGAPLEYQLHRVTRSDHRTGGKGRRSRVSLADQLREIVGDRHVIERDAELLVYESDGLPGTAQTVAGSLSRNTRRGDRVVRALAAAKASVRCARRGHGSIGRRLADDVVLLGLHRLKRIIDVDPRRLRATVSRAS